MDESTPCLLPSALPNLFMFYKKCTKFGVTPQEVVLCLRMIHVARRSALWEGH